MSVISKKKKAKMMRKHCQRISDFLRKNGDRIRTEESVRQEFEQLLEESRGAKCLSIT